MKLVHKLFLAAIGLASASEEQGGGRSLRGLQGNSGNGNGNGNNPHDDEEEEETLIVTFKGNDKSDAPSKCDTIAKAHGGNKKADYSKVLNGCSMRMKRKNVDALRRNKDVASIEWDQIMTASQVASWGLDRIDQCSGTDGSATKVDAANAKVFVLDTGVRGDHEDLASHVGTGCHFDATGEGYLSDGHGHGTHVASTACGTTYGVASNCEVCDVKVLSASGSGPNSGIIDGINHVVANCDTLNGDKCVANLSLGGGYSAALNAAVANAVAAGVTVVVAAGNDSADACNVSPASEVSAITVGSTTSQDGVSSFSNFGSCLDVYAPGTGITAASNTGGAVVMSGTSMASPHVAGIAAGILGEGYLPAQVTAELLSRVANVGVDSRSPGTGIATSVVEGCGAPPPTTPPPPEECTGHEIVVNVLTDNYPTDTTWLLKDACTDEPLASSGGALSNPNFQYASDPICAPVGGKFEFTINDSYGDGICCFVGNGHYSVDLDGAEVASGGEFTTPSETKYFGAPDCTGGSATTTPATTAATTTTEAPPPPATLDWTFEMTTDHWAFETQVTITEHGQSPTVYPFGHFAANTVYEYSGAWPSQGCHAIVVEDDYGDGIFFGSYSLAVDGSVVASYGGYENFSSRTLTFGGGCSGGSTTTSVQSNTAVAIREPPKGNNRGGNGKGDGNGAQGVIVVELPAGVEDEN